MRSKEKCCKTSAGNHDSSEIQEGSWPAPTKVVLTTRAIEASTQKHKHTAFARVLSGAWTQQQR